MKRLSELQVSLFSLLMVFVLAACGSAQENIVGKWADKTDGTEAVEFFKDKTLTMNVEGSKGPIFAGKWVALDDGRIKADILAFGMPMVIFFVFIGDELEIHMGSSKRRLIRSK